MGLPNISLDLIDLRAQHARPTFLSRRLSYPSCVPLIPHAIDAPVSAARTPAALVGFCKALVPPLSAHVFDALRNQPEIGKPDPADARKQAHPVIRSPKMTDS